MIKSLRIAANNFQSCLNELKNIDVREREANDKLSSAAESGSIDDPKTQRAIGDARMILDLCQGRRRVLKREIPAYLDELMEKFRHADKAVTAAVQCKMTAVCGCDFKDNSLDASKYNHIATVEVARRFLTFDFFIIAMEDAKRGTPQGARVPGLARTFCHHTAQAFSELGIELPAEPKEEKN
jgi:hypothetical protein